MSNKQLTRPRSNRMIAGVCAGVADYFNVDVTMVRLIFVLIVLFTGVPAFAYLVLWLVMPESDYVGTVYEHDTSHDDEIIVEKGGDF